MAYEIYKKKLNMEKYFNIWDSDSFDRLTNDLKKQIYEKYLIKCEVFQRDDFTCQNDNCLFCNNKKYADKLTMHHIKWQKNEGENKVRNGVTLCSDCHHSYHKAKYELVFVNESLPSHIQGHTFKLKKSNIINWKKVKKEMKSLRRGLRDECGIRLSWEQINILMKFLELDFNSEDD